MQIRNKQVLKERQVKATTSAVGPANYQSGARPTLTFANLRNIENVRDVIMQCDDAAYLLQPVSISGNILTYAVTQGNNGARSEATNGTDFSATGLNLTFRASAIGN